MQKQHEQHETYFCANITSSLTHSSLFASKLPRPSCEAYLIILFNRQATKNLMTPWYSFISLHMTALKRWRKEQYGSNTIATNPKSQTTNRDFPGRSLLCKQLTYYYVDIAAKIHSFVIFVHTPINYTIL